jgi:hypothetical protein
MRNLLPRLVAGLVVICGVAALWIIPSHAQQVPGTLAQPGMTSARVSINNRTADEAIPVSIVNGFAAVDFTEHAVGTLSQIQGRAQQTIAKRQSWEYHSVAAGAEQDLAAALNGLGNDGWEAVGVTSQPGGKMTILLKRPK